MDSRQWNLMIRMVNDGDPRAKAQELFSAEDMCTYDKMKAQLAELRSKNPKAAFSPVETEWS